MTMIKALVVCATVATASAQFPMAAVAPPVPAISIPVPAKGTNVAGPALSAAVDLPGVPKDSKLAPNNCPKDKYRTCPDGTVLERDPKYNCDFAPCPTEIDGVVDMSDGGSFSPLASAAKKFGPMPPATFSTKGSCKDSCGKKDAVNGCWCDEACSLHGDCCADKVQVCSKPVDVRPQGTVPMSCTNACGAQSVTAQGKCWCDHMCEKNGDCCADYKSLCGAKLVGDNGLSTMFAQPFAAPALPNFPQQQLYAPQQQQQFAQPAQQQNFAGFFNQQAPQFQPQFQPQAQYPAFQQQYQAPQQQYQAPQQFYQPQAPYPAYGQQQQQQQQPFGAQPYYGRR